MGDLQPKIATHASESGHWYDRDGNQVVEVPNAKGDKLIKTTLRQARILNLAPGVTTIIGCAAAPGLERWKIKQAILASLTLTRGDGETDEDWLRRIDTDSKEHAKAAAEEGTRIHAAIQSAIEGTDYDTVYKPHVDGVFDLLDSLDGNWLLDFKGKDGDGVSILNERLYDNHHMQLAATRRACRDFGVDCDQWTPEVACISQLGYGTKADLIRWNSDDPSELRAGIVFVSRTHPGATHIMESQPHQLGAGWGMFVALLRYWQAKNDYRPKWGNEVTQ